MYVHVKLIHFVAQQKHNIVKQLYSINKIKFKTYKLKKKR